MDVALPRVFKFNTRQCARQHPEYPLVSSLITYYMQTVCASGSNFLPQCVEGTSKVLIIRCSQGLFLLEVCVGGGGGRDIERNQWPGSSDIDGQDQCEHMLNLVTVIAIF